MRTLGPYRTLGLGTNGAGRWAKCSVVWWSRSNLCPLPALPPLPEYILMRTLTTALLFVFSLAPALAQEPLPCGHDEWHRIGAPIARSADFAQHVAQTTEQLETFTRTFQPGDRGGSGPYIIPVVFHIIHNNGAENIGDAQIRDAVRVLNNDFNRLNSDWDNVRPEFLDIVANIGVEFRLATRDPQGNCTNGITRTQSTLTNAGDDEMKELISWPRDRYMQVWVAAYADGAAGYTFRPGTANWIPEEDGIVMQHTYVGTIGTGSTGRSRTLTHEAGHWLNLAHTWGSSNEPGLASNCDMDDEVSDTPNTVGWTSCTLSGSSCGSELDNVENYMEYSYCSKMFTEGQKVRMIAALNSSTAQRNELWQEDNLINTGVNGNAILCAASFITNKREICAGGTIQYTDQSYHNIVSRTWSFPGGEPSTSTDASPYVTYPTSGTYAATLTVSDGTATLSTTQQNTVVVLSDPGAAPPFVEGFESATQPSDIGWTVVNNDGDNGYAITNAAAYSGSKSIRILNSATMTGRLDQLVSPTMDMSGVEEIVLSFRYAYARRNAENDDQLRVFVSSNCGETWSLRSQLFATSDLNTGGVVTGTFVPNSPAQWGFEEITTINSSFQVSDMRVRFDFFSGGGNHLYLDDININGLPVGLEEVAAKGSLDLRVQPNPTSGDAELLLDMAATDRVRIELVDVLGRSLSVMNDGALAAGQHRFEVPLEDRATGVYLVNVVRTNASDVIRVVVQR